MSTVTGSQDMSRHISQFFNRKSCFLFRLYLTDSITDANQSNNDMLNLLNTDFFSPSCLNSRHFLLNQLAVRKLNKAPAIKQPETQYTLIWFLSLNNSSFSKAIFIMLVAGHIRFLRAFDWTENLMKLKCRILSLKMLICIGGRERQ